MLIIKDEGEAIRIGHMGQTVEHYTHTHNKSITYTHFSPTILNNI